jgi:hypothetical protein
VRGHDPQARTLTTCLVMHRRMSHQIHGQARWSTTRRAWVGVVIRAVSQRHQGSTLRGGGSGSYPHAREGGPGPAQPSAKRPRVKGSDSDTT